ncbi:MAG TPA: GNAT family N-acetyltransferase [Thermohalobaculum sp.]|nr:GNAT family N-acetyltransferase [Thermohalobaculum sp.]
MKLDIRPMTEADMGVAIGWAAAEGWNPGRADLVPFRAEDPDGFLMGWLGDRPVAAISVIRYGADFGFLGFYIVVPDHRGQGHGIAIWRKGMARLEGRVVGLDGVVAQQANYARSGFVLAHRNIRHGGVVRAEAPKDARLRADAGAAEIEAFDRAFFPAPRGRFLRAWLGQPGHVVRALVEDGLVTGYGVLRPCGEGAKVGPLFAAGEADAEVLFRALAAGAPEGPVFLDTPEPNAAALSLAARFGMAPVFETARMYRGPAPDLPLARTFGITSFELG